MINFILKKSIPFLLLFSLFLSCTNDIPLDLNTGFVEQGSFKTIEKKVVASRTVTDIVNTGRGVYLVAGDFDGIVSEVLIRSDSLQRVTDSIATAQLVLPVHQIVGTATGRRLFLERVVSTTDTSWVETSIKWDSFSANYTSEQITEYVLPDTVGDAVNQDSMIIDIDLSVINGWRDNPASNHGFLLRTQTPGYQLELHARESLDRRPFLRLVTVANDSTTDTLQVVFNADVFIFERHTALAPDPLYLGNGEFHRIFVSFKVDSIPPIATITRAQLEFNLDNSSSTWKTDIFPIAATLASYIEASDSLALDLDSGVLSTTATPGDASFRLLVTSYVQNLVLSQKTDLGIAIIPNASQYNLARITAYSDATDASRAPRLKIEYTVPPGSE